MPICLLSPLLAAAMAASAGVPVNTGPLAAAGSVEAAATRGTLNAQTASPTVTFSTPGPKTVTLRACNSGGCSMVTKTVTVLDPAPRIGTISGPTIVGTSDGPVTYSATVAGRPPLAYNWRLTLPDGSMDSVSSPAFTWTPASVGDHRLDLTLSNLWGSQSSSLAVAVVPTVFADIPPSFFAASFIETLYFSGFTAGCSLDGSARRLFCPANPVSRAELAVFLGRGLHPPPFVPPSATGIFADVPPDYWAGPWIEQAYRDGIASGCAAGSIRLFCPQSLATRAELAVLFVRAVHGATFLPPAAMGIFGDVPAGYWAAPWIEQLYRDGITAGCQGGPAPLFCPAATTTRAEVAVFLVRAFHLVERPTPLAFAARLCASTAACSYPAGMPIDFVLQLSGGIPPSYDYDWNGDGSYEESAPFPRSHVYEVPGVYRPQLRLRLGSWSAVILHPYPLKINPAVTSSPLPPATLTAAVTTLVAPAATDPPGTPLLVGYSVSAVDPPGILGYAAYVNSGGSYRFVRLLAPRRGAADLLLLPTADPRQVRFLSLRAFTATGFGPSSLPVRLP